SSNGFKRYASLNESNFMRGVACTVKSGKVISHTFLSHKSIDGNTKEGVLTGFYTSGLHRTVNELAKKNAVKELLVGSNIVYTGQNYQVGITNLYSLLS